VPGVFLPAAALFQLDVLDLEIGVGPPMLAVPVTVHRLGEQLTTVRGQFGELDAAANNRPKAPTAGWVFEIKA
jgi:hypothetical protein